MLRISFNAVDKTDKVIGQSFSLSRAITSQPDTFSGEVAYPNGGWVPSLRDEVLVEESSDGAVWTAIFGGEVVEIEKTLDGGVPVARFQCRDHSFTMDRKLVVEVYEATSIEAIIADIAASYLAGFTTAGVSCPVVVSSITFNYEQTSRVLAQLADLVNYDWEVTPTKDIRFFAKSSSMAPFGLSDDGGKYYIDTLVVTEDLKGVRNSITVRGGEYEGDTETYEIVADGEQKVFNLPYRFKNASIAINGVSKTLGVDQQDDADDFDALYNEENRIVKFREGNKPTVGQVFAITGNPLLPVVSKVLDPVSVAELGEFEYKVVDKSIASKEGARARAKAELRSWAAALEEGSFETREVGLDAGQTIRVQSTARGIDQSFVITRISTTVTNGSDALHRVTLSTTKTYGIIEFLQGLLTAKDKEIVISTNEIVDNVRAVSEGISLDEAVTLQDFDYPVEFVLGPMSYPRGYKRPFILDGSPLS